jgi:molybdate transport system permease protein
MKWRTGTISHWLGIGLVSIAVISLGVLLLLPLATLLLRAIPGWLSGDWQGQTVWAALRLSLVTATLSTLLAVIFGTPVAYLLARYQTTLLQLVDILVDLPLVLPPAVAGIALLMAFGRASIPGQVLDSVGVSLPFTTAAVVVAQTFVATPFYIRAAKAGFVGVNPKLEIISATLGESSTGTFFRVTLPLARKTLLGGVVMAWARALGEFGATILFAGNFIGRTQTMPLAIYTALQTDLNTALVLASILLLTSLVLLLALRFVIR